MSGLNDIARPKTATPVGHRECPQLTIIVQGPAKPCWYSIHKKPCRLGLLPCSSLPAEGTSHLREQFQDTWRSKQTAQNQQAAHLATLKSPSGSNPAETHDLVFRSLQSNVCMTWDNPRNFLPDVSHLRAGASVFTNL